MVPAYVLTGLFFLVWLLQSTALAGRPVKPTSRRLGHWARHPGAGDLCCPADREPLFRFPRPSGPYAVGTVTYHWVDAARPEIFTADPNDHRELMVHVPKMFHLNLTDVPLLIYAPFGRGPGLVRADRCPSSTSHRQRLHPGVLRPSSQGHAGNAARWTSSTVPRSPHRLAPPLIHFPIRTVLVNNAQLPSPQPPCKPVIAEQEVWAADHLAGVRTS
jgi:hypothetical protein